MLSRLIERRPEIPGVWTIVLEKPSGFKHTAGDYTELELDYGGGGGRRWFSLSSAPDEEYLTITFKLPEPHSRFKAELMKLMPGDRLQISPPMGNFNLPPSPRPVLFVAIGIGVTPFRAIVRQLTLVGKLNLWDIRMLHAAKPKQFLFEDVFALLGQARQKTGVRPRLDEQSVKQLVPDWQKRMIYLAGPEAVTSRIHHQLSRQMAPSQLRLSYFPGYKISDS